MFFGGMIISNNDKFDNNDKFGSNDKLLQVLEDTCGQ